MFTSASGRSLKSPNHDIGECRTSTSSSEAMTTRSGAQLTSVVALEDHDYNQAGPMLMSPPADSSPDPTGSNLISTQLHRY